MSVQHSLQFICRWYFYPMKIHQTCHRRLCERVALTSHRRNTEVFRSFVLLSENVISEQLRVVLNQHFLWDGHPLVLAVRQLDGRFHVCKFILAIECLNTLMTFIGVPWLREFICHHHFWDIRILRGGGHSGYWRLLELELWVPKYKIKVAGDLQKFSFLKGSNIGKSHWLITSENRSMRELGQGWLSCFRQPWLFVYMRQSRDTLEFVIIEVILFQCLYQLERVINVLFGQPRRIFLINRHFIYEAHFQPDHRWAKKKDRLKNKTYS